MLWLTNLSRLSGYIRSTSAGFPHFIDTLMRSVVLRTQSLWALGHNSCLSVDPTNQ